VKRNLIYNYSPIMTMGLIRSVLRKASPKRFKGVVKESKSWHFVCKTCGYKKSVYDSGGIRYKKQIF